MKKVIVLVVVITLSISTVMAKYIKDEAYYKDFIKFLKVSGSTETQKVMLKSMFEQFKKRPNAKQKIFDNMENMMKDELTEFNKNLYPVYKKTFIP